MACRACCDLVADRRLCLTGTPVQNKLDDVYALIKFLRMAPFDDKSTWTEFIGTPVKYAQPLGTARLKTIMGCITLRRTKESRANGEKILTLPQRTDHLLELKFSEEEQKFYDRFFTESRAEFSEMSNRNEVMKNYVGILQKILRLRQICDHLDLVRDKGLGLFGDNQYQLPASYEDLATVITNEGLNCTRANAVFALLREAGTAQCVECSYELGLPSDTASDGFTGDAELSAGQGKRRGKPKTPASRTSTRQNSPTGAQIVLTRCQHLFCIACFRGSCFPKWPQVPSDQRRACSVCQTCLSPGDAVEVVPECPLVETKKKNGKREKRVKVPGRACASTKIRTLVESLRELSFANPHSDNFVKGEDEMQLVVTPKVTKSVVL